MSSLVIDRTMFVYGRTDEPTDLPIDGPKDRHVQSDIPPLLRKGGVCIIIYKMSSMNTNAKMHKKHFNQTRESLSVI